MKTPFRTKTIHTHELLAGKYLVEGRIGTGGMGKIYRALQGDMQRTVAVKVIDMAEMSPDMIARFRREMEMLAKLQIANVIPIYDYDKFKGHDFYVMPLLTGGSLKQRIDLRAERNLPLPSAGEVNQRLQLLCQALHRVHQKGIIHRDIKPTNIMVDEHGTPFIIDFGIAREAKPQIGITSTSVVIGTWPYMCLAQLNADEPSYTFDLYALAVTFYEVLNGCSPFKSQEDRNQIDYIVELRSPALTLQGWREDLPASLKAVFIKAFSQRSAEQYPDMLAFATDFAKATQSLPADDTGFFTFPVPQPVVDIHDQPSTLQSRLPTMEGPTAGARNASRSFFVSWLPWLIAGGVLLAALVGGLLVATLPPLLTITPTATSPTVQVAANPTMAMPDVTLLPTLTPAPSIPTDTLTPTPTACDVLLNGVLNQDNLDQWRASGCVEAYARTNDLLGEMVLVPCLAGEADCTPLWVNRYEITRGQADRDGDPALPWTGDVVGVRASQWCEDRDGRLLTEAEWRWASGASFGWHYPWGMDSRTDYPVPDVLYDPRSYLADTSWAGVVGMGGNASEWIEGSRRMGSHFRGPEYFRIDSPPIRISAAAITFGFRCAKVWEGSS